jgi:hypothetical protein
LSKFYRKIVQSTVDWFRREAWMSKSANGGSLLSLNTCSGLFEAFSCENDLDENLLNYRTFVSGGHLEFIRHFEFLFLKIHIFSIYGLVHGNVFSYN